MLRSNRKKMFWQCYLQNICVAHPPGTTFMLWYNNLTHYGRDSVCPVNCKNTSIIISTLCCRGHIPGDSKSIKINDSWYNSSFFKYAFFYYENNLITFWLEGNSWQVGSPCHNKDWRRLLRAVPGALPRCRERAFGAPPIPPLPLPAAEAGPFFFSRIRAARGAGARATRACESAHLLFMLTFSFPESEQQQQPSKGREERPKRSLGRVFPFVGRLFSHAAGGKHCAFLHAESQRATDRAGKESWKRPLHKVDRWIHPENIWTCCRSFKLHLRLCLFSTPEWPAAHYEVAALRNNLRSLGPRLDYQPNTGCAWRRLHGPWWWTRETKHTDSVELILRARSPISVPLVCCCFEARSSVVMSPSHSGRRDGAPAT